MPGINLQYINLYCTMFKCTANIDVPGHVIVAQMNETKTALRLTSDLQLFAKCEASGTKKLSRILRGKINPTPCLHPCVYYFATK